MVGCCDPRISAIRMGPWSRMLHSHASRAHFYSATPAKCGSVFLSTHDAVRILLLGGPESQGVDAAGNQPAGLIATVPVNRCGPADC